MKSFLKLKNHPWSLHTSDSGLSALTFTQVFITFVAVPLIATQVAGQWLMDASLLVFAIICSIAFTNRRIVQAVLLCFLLTIVLGPSAWSRLTQGIALNPSLLHETISLAAFCFNLLVIVLVAHHSFGEGQVTGHRILGAVLVYLNVAVLFSIAYDMLDTYSGGAIRPAAGGLLLHGQARVAELSYFSLATITTCGYGDLVPVHPLARSMANLEAVFGALFPATFVARLVALHLSHNEDENRD